MYSGSLRGKLVLISLSVVCLFGCSQSDHVDPALGNENSKVSLTFDDGSTKDMPGYTLKEWNQMILNHLKENNLKAVLFVTGSYLNNEKGNYVLSSWNGAGHKIGNHSFTHPYFNSSKITLEDFEIELLENDSLIKVYSNYYPRFRFPYLKEGNTKEKRDGFRKFLKDHNYKIGYVTIDNSAWYICGRLIKRLKENPDTDISEFRKFYLDHIYERAMFYDSLAYKLTHRRIHHVLLLHHNLTSALFLDDLIKMFKSKGWEIINAEEAYKDKIYKQEPKNIPAGESLIWALAKESGKYNDILRYPGEDSKYEKDKMDRLGL